MMKPKSRGTTEDDIDTLPKAAKSYENKDTKEGAKDEKVIICDEKVEHKIADLNFDITPKNADIVMEKDLKEFNTKEDECHDEIVKVASISDSDINKSALDHSFPENIDVADAFSMILDVITDEGIIPKTDESEKTNNQTRLSNVSSNEHDGSNSPRQSDMPDLVPIEGKPLSRIAYDEYVEKHEDTKGSQSSLENPSELLEDLMTSITTGAVCSEVSLF